MTYTKAEVLAAIAKHNNGIERFMDEKLPELLAEHGYPVKHGKVAIQAWFVANGLIQAQGFYEKGMEVLRKFRDDGYDVKMDMQTNKLVFEPYRN